MISTRASAPPSSTRVRSRNGGPPALLRSARRMSTPILPRSANGSSNCERSDLQTRGAPALDGRGDIRLVPARHIRLLPAVRHLVLDKADWLLSGLTMAFRSD